MLRQREKLESKLPYQEANFNLTLDTLPLEFSQVSDPVLLGACEKLGCKDLILELREKFQKAGEIVMITGTFGLGDCIMELRFALHMAKKVKKPFTIQVHPALLPLLSGWSSQLPNVKFVDRCDPAVLLRDAFFIMTGSS